MREVVRNESLVMSWEAVVWSLEWSFCLAAVIKFQQGLTPNYQLGTHVSLFLIYTNFIPALSVSLLSISNCGNDFIKGVNF
jgi:hypothetical protein